MLFFPGEIGRLISQPLEIVVSRPNYRCMVLSPPLFPGGPRGRSKLAASGPQLLAFEQVFRSHDKPASHLQLASRHMAP